jgi:hypothetical protein
MLRLERRAQPPSTLEQSNLRTNARLHGAMPLRMAQVRIGSAHRGPLAWQGRRTSAHNGSEREVNVSE